MQRDKGWRAPKSGIGFPHGKDQRKERAKRTQERLAEKKPAVEQLGWESKK